MNWKFWKIDKEKEYLNYLYGKERLGSAHRCGDKTERNLAGAIDLQEYSMLLLPPTL